MKLNQSQHIVQNQLRNQWLLKMKFWRVMFYSIMIYNRLKRSSFNIVTLFCKRHFWKAENTSMFSPWKKRWGKCDIMWAKWIRLIWVCWLLLCRIRGSAHEEAKPRLFNTIAIFNLAFNSPAAFAHPNNQSWLYSQFWLSFAIFTESYNI